MEIVINVVFRCEKWEAEWESAEYTNDIIRQDGVVTNTGYDGKKEFKMVRPSESGG